MLIVCVAKNIQNMTLFEASIYLPGGTVACLHVTLFLVFTTGVSMLISRKCLPLHTLCAVVLVLSIIFVTQPELLFGEDDHPIYPICSRDTHEDAMSYKLSVGYLYSYGNNSSDVSTMSPMATLFSPNLLIYYTYLVICASASTLNCFCINKKLKNVNPFALSLSVAISGIVFSLAGVGIFETPIVPFGTNCQLLLVGHAVCASSFSILNVVALQFITAHMFSLMAGLDTVFLCVAQYTVLKKINPGHGNVMHGDGRCGRGSVGYLYWPCLCCVQEH